MGRAPRKAGAWVAGVLAAVLAGYLAVWAVALVFGVRLLPVALLPHVAPAVPRASPESVVAHGAESGKQWSLTAHTLGEQSCVQVRVQGADGSGQCGYRPFRQDPRYSASVAELPGTGRSLVFGPVPANTASVAVRFGDGTSQVVPAASAPTVPVRFFQIVTDHAGEGSSPEIRLLDAQGHDIPV